eukprot:COSAG02_NODE_18847_length_914_cov_1.350920_2_plen_125_part_00
MVQVDAVDTRVHVFEYPRPLLRCTRGRVANESRTKTGYGNTRRRSISFSRARFDHTLAASCSFLLLDGTCASDCTCKWTVLSPDGTRWSGITGEIATVTAETIDDCQDACCDGKKAPAGCVAFR